MFNIVLVIHVLLALGLIGLILIQQGKGADMGAAFGAGASGTVFGSQGAGNFMSRLTGYLATAFFITSLVLAYLSTQAVKVESLADRVAPTEQVSEPAPASPGADVPAVPESSAPGGSEVPAIPGND